MCFLSICKLVDDVVITHNRDESINRTWSPGPTKHKIRDKLVTAPIDPISGGTWIGNTAYETLAILNGAFVKHEKKLSYAKSRGTIIMDYFLSGLTYEKYIDILTFNDYEPFTLIKVDHFDATIVEVVWDSNEVHINKKSVTDTPLVYSSATLYDPQTKSARNVFFQNWFDLTKDAENIFDLHSEEGENFSEYLRVQISEEIKTVSTLQIHISDTIKVKYKDYLTGKVILINSHFASTV